MAAGNESAGNTSKTRQSSLRYHKLREVTPVPEFFETDSLPNPYDSSIIQPSVQSGIPHPKQYQFAMNKIGLFGFLLTLTFVGVLLFSSGFLVAYTYYAPSHKMASEMSQYGVNPKPLQTAAVQPNPQNLQQSPASLAPEKPVIPKPSALPQTEGSTDVSSKGAELIIADVPVSSMEDKLAELKKDPTQVPLNKEDLQKSVGDLQEEIQGDTTDTATKLASEKIQDILGADTKIDAEEGIAVEIPQPPFAIEFGRSDSEQTAREMVNEMIQQGIKAEVSRSINPHGKLTYHVRSSFYNDYETAYSALIKLSPPFSLWGTIVRGDMKEAPEARR
jgi:hypothetical protein